MVRLRRLLLILAVVAAAPHAALLPQAWGAPVDVPLDQRVVALVFANSLATWTGSGFVVGDGRWIVTNHHVATRKFSPEKFLTLHEATVLSPWTGQAHRARVVAVDQQADLALLRLQDVTLPSLPLAPADFLEHPPVLPRPPVQLFGFPSLADRAAWEASETSHHARTQAVGMSLWQEIPVLLLAPAEGPAKGWSGGPAVWSATGKVVGVFNALVSYPERPDRWNPQVIGIARLRAFLTQSGVEAASLDHAALPTSGPPRDAAEAFRRLIRLTSAGFVDEWSAAEREARALVRLRSASPEARCILGTVLASAGKNDDALKALDESHRLAPNAAATLYQRAQVLRALGRRDDAVADLRRAFDLDPEDAETLLALGQVLADLGRHAEARVALRRGIKLAPNHPLLHWELAQALRHQGVSPEALSEARTAVDLAAETESLRPLRVRYARMLAQAGHADEAEKELREAVRLDKEDAGAHMALASFLADAGRKEEARREAETVLTLKPTEDLRDAATALLNSLGPAVM